MASGLLKQLKKRKFSIGFSVILYCIHMTRIHLALYCVNIIPRRISEVLYYVNINLIGTSVVRYCVNINLIMFGVVLHCAALIWRGSD